MNINNYYNKDYFKDLDFHFLLTKGATASDNIKKEIKERNNKLLQATLGNTIPNEYASHKLHMKIDYPGLVTGVGIGHEANIEGEFKLGMHFDYTTGQPIIYGSSVKGVLRSYFKDVYDGEVDDCDSVIKDIFEGKDSTDNMKPMYSRDVFFDAVIIKENKHGHLLAADSITPHKYGPLKNPIPITFMKIAPGCELEFRFHLVKSEVNGKTITPEDKRKWFKEILTTFGIGAKTNVGYGQLTAIK